MKEIIDMNIQIADTNNNVLFDCRKGEEELVVNTENVQVVKLTPGTIQLKIKNFHTKKASVSFNGFPIGEPVANVWGVNKVMWNKLVKSGTAAMYNEMYDVLKETDMWHSPDGGKTNWDTGVMAHNAAILYLSTKFKKTGISKVK